MSNKFGQYTFVGSAPFEGVLGSLEFFTVSTVVSSGGGGGGEIFNRLVFNPSGRLFCDGTALRLFPVT